MTNNPAPVKRRVGRPTGTPNPNAGRKPGKTWEQRHRDEPDGASPLLVTIPHGLGWWLEARANQEGISIQSLLVTIAQSWAAKN